MSRCFVRDADTSQALTAGAPGSKSKPETGPTITARFAGFGSPSTITIAAVAADIALERTVRHDLEVFRTEAAAIRQSVQLGLAPG